MEERERIAWLEGLLQSIRGQVSAGMGGTIWGKRLLEQIDCQVKSSVGNLAESKAEERT